MVADTHGAAPPTADALVASICMGPSCAVSTLNYAGACPNQFAETATPYGLEATTWLLGFSVTKCYQPLPAARASP